MRSQEASISEVRHSLGKWNGFVSIRSTAFPIADRKRRPNPYGRSPGLCPGGSSSLTIPAIFSVRRDLPWSGSPPKGGQRSGRCRSDYPEISVVSTIAKRPLLGASNRKASGVAGGSLLPELYVRTSPAPKSTHCARAEQRRPGALWPARRKFGLQVCPRHKPGTVLLKRVKASSQFCPMGIAHGEGLLAQAIPQLRDECQSLRWRHAGNLSWCEDFHALRVHSLQG